MGPIVNPSAATRSNASDEDQFNAAGKCGNGGPLAGDNATAIEERSGYGLRLPRLVISPFVKDDFVNHTATSQTSPIRLIEDNRNLGRLGNGSFDQVAGPIDNIFDFDRDHSDGHGDDGRRPLLLGAQTGQPTSH